MPAREACGYWRLVEEEEARLNGRKVASQYPNYGGSMSAPLIYFLAMDGE